MFIVGLYVGVYEVIGVGIVESLKCGCIVEFLCVVLVGNFLLF